MEKKNLQSLFSSHMKEYDKKHKLNTSHKVLNMDLINKIEREGITTEMLDDLDQPIYKYSTQITVHGIFPEGADVRCSGYKSLVRNGNGSLGIRYTAIDSKKKSRLLDLLNAVEKGFWQAEHDSRHYSIIHIERVTSTEQVKPLLERTRQIKKDLDDMVLGKIHCELYEIYGIRYCTIEVDLLSFYEKDMEKILRAMAPNFKGTISEVDEIIKQEQKEKEEKDKLQRAQWEKEYKERKLKEAETLKKSTEEVVRRIKDMYEPMGFVHYDEIDLQNRTVDTVHYEREYSYSFDMIPICSRIEGKNKVLNSEKMEKDFSKPYHSWKETNRIQGTKLKNVWVRPVK